MSVLFISHDLGVVGEIADHVVVMRDGLIREQGPVADIFASPQDDYTKALLACRPSLTENPARLMVIDDHIAGKAAARRCGGQGPGRAGGAGGALAGQELLPARGDLRTARVQGRRGRELPAAQGAHAGRRRRVRFRQDDDGADAAAPARADRRRGHLRRPEPAQAVRPRPPADAPAHPDRVPEPVREPEPALHDRPDPGRADGDPRHRQGPGRARAARARRCWRRSAWTAAPSASTRTSSPAASASAWRSRAA